MNRLLLAGGRVAKTRATEILSTLGPWTPDTAPNTSVQTRKLKLSCYRKTLIIDKPPMKTMQKPNLKQPAFPKTVNPRIFTNSNSNMDT